MTANQEQVLFSRCRLESTSSSRQSVVSNYSQVRSARSSMSSRISHYLPALHGSSTRSSITSAYLATPQSTRSNSPNSCIGLVGEAPEYRMEITKYTEHDGSSMCDERLQSFPDEFASRLSASEYDQRIVIVDRYGSARVDPRLTVQRSRPGDPRRLTVLRDPNIDDADEDMFVGQKTASSTQMRKNIALRMEQSLTEQWQSDRFVGSSGTVDRGSPCNSPNVELVADYANSLSFQSIEHALKIKRLKSCFRSSTVVPFKPDTPVPPALKPDIHVERSFVKEPVPAYVCESLMPYVCGSSIHNKPAMSHLRVPGRQPPQVPQTIIEIEEDTLSMTPPCSPQHSGGNDASSSITAIARKRKNASSWLAPPVIDVMEARDATCSKDMKVECPGVIVEHHN